MSSDNKGLTVGELTIAIGSLIIAILIWSSFNKEGRSSNTNLDLNTISRNNIESFEIKNQLYLKNY